MTKEEAAEEILNGQAYTQCTRCGGSGWSGKPPRLGIIGMREHCSGCNGSGQWLRGDYVQACSIIGREPPPKPKPLMFFKPSETLMEHIKKFGHHSTRSTYFDEIAELPRQDLYRKEYMGKWEPEPRNDTLDALKYAMESTRPNGRIMKL
jgi:hypothetical protein